MHYSRRCRNAYVLEDSLPTSGNDQAQPEPTAEKCIYDEQLHRILSAAPTRAGEIVAACHRVCKRDSPTPCRVKRRCTYDGSAQVGSCSRDPIGFFGSQWNQYGYVSASPISRIDPLGLKDCKITIYGGHNFSIADMLTDDYPNPDGDFDDNLEDGDPWVIPPGECVVGVGCGTGVDVDGDGEPDSIQDYLNEHYPCNSISAPNLCSFDDPMNGLAAEIACRNLRYAYKKAQAAAGRMLDGRPPNTTGDDCRVDCDTVTIEIKCDKGMKGLADDGIWQGNPVPPRVRRGCAGLCGKTVVRK